jgi:cytochrome b6-f complex iron-sulfur subunit
METNQAQPETMNRASFLRGLGLSSAALMSVYCASGLVACGSKDTTVTPTPTPLPGGGNTSTGLTGNASTGAGAINFTLDLSNANYSKLKTVGEFAAVGDIVVANAKGVYVAIGRICTHDSGNLNYKSSDDTFVCDKHGGIYNNNGTVKAAPPSKAVVAYKAAVSGSNLTVTA